MNCNAYRKLIWEHVSVDSNWGMKFFIDFSMGYEIFFIDFSMGYEIFSLISQWGMKFFEKNRRGARL